MAYDTEEWERIKTYYEAGMALKDIVNRKDVMITNKSTIVSRAKREDWIFGKNERLLNDAAEANTLIHKVNTLRKEQSPVAFQAWDSLLREKINAINYLESAALENTKQAMEMACDNQHEFKARADTINKAKETLIGRSPETAVQVNNNNNQPQKIVYEVIDSSAANK
jgi:hypothetical protein